jgi:predicted PurR-regulated permease PerM
VLHHVGPLAGTALVAGTGGTVVFAAIGFVASIPFLLRLRRRFKTWIAPSIGLVAFAAAFSFSTFVIGPLISNERTGPSDAPTEPEPKVTDEHGHTPGR